MKMNFGITCELMSSKIQNRIHILPVLPIEEDGEDMKDIEDDVGNCEICHFEFSRHCHSLIIKCLNCPSHKENLIDAVNCEEEVQEMTFPP